MANQPWPAPLPDGAAEAAVPDPASAKHPVEQAGDYTRFPGCRPIPLLSDRLTDFDGRLEYWEARTQTAWVVAEPAGGIHEGTSRRLPHLAERIALVRGSPIASFGSVDLLVRDPGGGPEHMMQADETLYLHPNRATLPEGSLIVGEHDLPDVVLEVDHTTDVRRGKLPLYEAWGFPELWVMVPQAGATRRKPAGVTIHRLEASRYRTAAASGAFPGWTALEIHAALTERTPTAQTWRVLERVGRALGAREGTGPDNTPLLRSIGEQARAAGRSVLQARGVEVSDSFPAGSPPFAEVTRDALMAAAVTCTDEADFWRHLAPPRR